MPSLLVLEHPCISEIWPDQGQNAQEAFRKVSVKEQSSFEVQARCRWRRVTRGQAEFLGMFVTPRRSLTSDRSHSFADNVQYLSSTGCGVQMITMWEDN
eukprot:1145725-Pelagomonas_calceolata.AAC.4